MYTYTYLRYAKEFKYMPISELTQVIEMSSVNLILLRVQVMALKNTFVHLSRLDNWKTLCSPT